MSCLITRSLKSDSPSLFQRAICQSGSPSTMKFRPATWEFPAWDLLLKTFGLDDPALTAAQRVAGLRKVDAQELCDFAMNNSGMGVWGGIIQQDGMWPTHPEVAMREGRFDRGVKEFVLGCNQDEGTLFAAAFQVRRIPFNRVWRVTASRSLIRFLSSLLPADWTNIFLDSLPPSPPDFANCTPSRIPPHQYHSPLIPPREYSPLKYFSLLEKLLPTPSLSPLIHPSSDSTTLELSYPICQKDRSPPAARITRSRFLSFSVRERFGKWAQTRRRRVRR